MLGGERERVREKEKERKRKRENGYSASVARFAMV
jgi:hypothetical protein